MLRIAAVVMLVPTLLNLVVVGARAIFGLTLVQDSTQMWLGALTSAAQVLFIVTWLVTRRP